VAVRDPLWPAFVALPTILLIVGRRSFGTRFRKIGEAYRSVWRGL
jgi:hypothetical protein